MNITMTSPSGVRLLTAGKFCAEHVEVTPALESITALSNGTYTPGEGYAGLGRVTVQVAAPDGYVLPSGTKTITEDGTYDITEYAAVTVSVSPAAAVYDGSVTVE